MQTRYCPECGAHTFIAQADNKSFCCTACGFTYFHNIAAATSVFVRYKNEIILCERAFEPAKGAYDLPGGFQEAGESFEEGAMREVREELALQLPSVRYLFSLPNTYLYKGVSYYTSDCYFETVLPNRPPITTNDDVAGFKWVSLEQINTHEIAFENLRLAIERYKELLRCAS